MTDLVTNCCNQKFSSPVYQQRAQKAKYCGQIGAAYSSKLLTNSKGSFRSSQLFLILSRISTYLMETEGSSPYAQQHDTCSYPNPDQSSLRPHSFSCISVLILFCHLRSFQSGVLPSGLPTKTPVLTSPLSHTFYMPPHSFSLIR